MNIKYCAKSRYFEIQLKKILNLSTNIVIILFTHINSSLVLFNKFKKKVGYRHTKLSIMVFK